jgi:dihydrofolate synthase/folylpolyglutamate synthase
VQKALSQVRKLTGLHGRWETIHEHPAVILDVAHNEDGMAELYAQLEVTTYKHLHIIIGMVKDKPVEQVLALLPNKAKYYFTRARIPRAMPEEELAAIGKTFDLEGHHYPDVNTALKAAKSNAEKEDLILVCGSVFVVGEVEKRSLVTN